MLSKGSPGIVNAIKDENIVVHRAERSGRPDEAHACLHHGPVILGEFDNRPPAEREEPVVHRGRRHHPCERKGRSDQTTRRLAPLMLAEEDHLGGRVPVEDQAVHRNDSPRRGLTAGEHLQRRSLRPTQSPEDRIPVWQEDVQRLGGRPRLAPTCAPEPVPLLLPLGDLQKVARVHIDGVASKPVRERVRMENLAIPSDDAAVVGPERKRTVGVDTQFEDDVKPPHFSAILPPRLPGHATAELVPPVDRPAELVVDDRPSGLRPKRHRRRLPLRGGYPAATGMSDRARP